MGLEKGAAALTIQSEDASHFVEMIATK